MTTLLIIIKISAIVLTFYLQLQYVYLKKSHKLEEYIGSNVYKVFQILINEHFETSYNANKTVR